jgi:hypothetical protein
MSGALQRGSRQVAYFPAARTGRSSNGSRRSARRRGINRNKKISGRDAGAIRHHHFAKYSIYKRWSNKKPVQGCASLCKRPRDDIRFRYVRPGSEASFKKRPNPRLDNTVCPCPFVPPTIIDASVFREDLDQSVTARQLLIASNEGIPNPKCLDDRLGDVSRAQEEINDSQKHKPGS